MFEIVDLGNGRVAKQPEQSQASEPVKKNVFIDRFSLNDILLGSTSELTSGLVDFDDLNAAIAAANPGDSIKILPSYVPTAGAVTVNKELNIEGKGHLTNITAAGDVLNVNSNFCTFLKVRVQGDVSIISDGVHFLMGWQANGFNITDSGTGNALGITQE